MSARIGSTARQEPFDKIRTPPRPADLTAWISSQVGGRASSRADFPFLTQKKTLTVRVSALALYAYTTQQLRTAVLRVTYVTTGSNQYLTLPPKILSFTQKSERVMELDGSLAKEALRARQIPSPRCGGGLGWGGQSIAVPTFNEPPLPLPPPARGGANNAAKAPLIPPLSPCREGSGPRNRSEFWVKLKQDRGEIKRGRLMDPIVNPHLTSPNLWGRDVRFLVLRWHVMYFTLRVVARQVYALRS